MKKSVKYIFIDIDGTLYSNKENIVPVSSLVAINRLRDNNHKVFLCTGRSIGEAKQFIDFSVDGFIFASGSLIKIGKKDIFNHFMKKKDLIYLENILNECNLGYCMEGKSGGYCNDLSYKIITKYFFKNLNDNIYHSISNMSENEIIYKIGVYSYDINSLYNFKKIINHKYDFKVTLIDFQNNTFAGEITYKGINKFEAIKKVIKFLNADISDTVAVGDSENDIEMILGCSIGIAMGNSSEIVKNSSDFIADDILSDGLFKVFKKLKLI